MDKESRRIALCGYKLSIVEGPCNISDVTNDNETLMNFSPRP